MENVISSLVNRFLSDNNILPCTQSSFSCSYNGDIILLNIADDIVNEGEITRRTLLDFTKMFNTISHNMVAVKLSSDMGVGSNEIDLVR